MAKPFENRVQHNTNEYNDEHFCKLEWRSFCDGLYVKTVSGCISTITMSGRNATISRPEMSDDDFNVTRGSAYDCEICVDSKIVTTEEDIALDERFSSTYKVCENDLYYICLDIRAEADKKRNRKLAESMDAYVFETAVGLAETNFGTIDWTNADEIKALFYEADEQYIGMDIGMTDKCAVLPAVARKALAGCFEARLTAKGDQVCITGKVEMYDGWKIIFVAPSQLPTGVEAIFSVGKPVDLYMSEAGFMKDVRWAQASSQNCLSLNKIDYRLLHAKAHIWNCNQHRISIAAPTNLVGQGAPAGDGDFVGQTYLDVDAAQVYSWDGTTWATV